MPEKGNQDAERSNPGQGNTNNQPLERGDSDGGIEERGPAALSDLNTKGDWMGYQDNRQQSSGTTVIEIRESANGESYIYFNPTGRPGDGQAISMPEREQPYIVEGALVRCYFMQAETSVSRMIAGSGPRETVGGALKLIHTDIEFWPNFGRCIKTGRICEPEIVGEEWQEYDGDNVSNGGHGLLIDDSFMMCEEGGIIYITEDGQTPASKNVSLLKKLLLGRAMVAEYSKDPVNMATGNFVYEQTDLEIEGVVPLSFERFYNAQSNFEAVLGLGWIHNFEMQVIQEPTLGGVSILFEDGHYEHYYLDEKGNYIPPEGKYATLTRPEKTGYHKVEDREYLLEFPDRSSYLFDVEGKIVQKRDRHGREVTFEYKDRLLTRISSISGELLFSYDNKKMHSIAPIDESLDTSLKTTRLVAVKDHTGREVRFTHGEVALNTYVLSAYINTRGNRYRYTYDKLRLQKLINEEGGIAVENVYDHQDCIIKQFYADGGEMDFEYRSQGDIRLRERDGSEIIYKRDRFYRNTEVVHQGGGTEYFKYDNRNQLIESTDRNNNKTEYEYDEQGNRISTKDSIGNLAKYSYTSRNQIKSMSINEQTKAQVKYDEYGKLQSLENAIGQKNSFTYIEKGLPETITQPDGSIIRIYYDGKKNITKVVDGTGISNQYRYNDLQQVVATIDGNGNETRFRYDTEGNLTEVLNPSGHIRSYSYNRRGLVTEIKDFDDTTVKREYDYLRYPTKLIDQLERETKLSYDLMWNLSEIEEANGAQTKYTYNKQNLLESLEKPNGAVVQYRYDFNGNRTAVIDEEGFQTQFVYDALNRLIEVSDIEGVKIRYTRDTDGNVTAVEDALGNIVYLTYNEIGQLLEEKNPLGETRRYTYTPLGKVESFTDEARRKTHYEYKIGGQLQCVYHPDGTTEKYTYDNNGNVKTYTNQQEIQKEYFYDSLNQVIQIHTTSPDGEFKTTKTFTYDPVGNTTSVTDEDGYTIFYEYSLTGKLSKAIDPLGNEIRYIYDLCDRLIEVRQCSKDLLEKETLLDLDADYQQVIEWNKKGEIIPLTRYQRDISGQVEKVINGLGYAEEFKYNGKGQLIETIDKDGYLRKYGYTSAGDVASIQYDDGRKVKYSYDSLRRLKQVEDWLGTIKINHDSLGRTTQVTDHNQRTIRYTWGSGDVRESIIYPDGKEVKYQYDEFLRLEKVIDGSMETNYNYDRFGRLIEKKYHHDLRTKYEYDSLGRIKWLLHETPENLLDGYLFSYDKRDNKIGADRNHFNPSDKSREKVNYQYIYDPMNRLQQVQLDGEAIRTYNYDGYGNRINLMEGDKTTSYYYNALNQLISTKDNLGNEQSYSYDNRGNMKEINQNGLLTHQYYFGALNRLEKAYNYEKELGAVYKYNGLGHRIEKTEGRLAGKIIPSTIENPVEFLNQMELSPTKEIEDIIDFTHQYNNLLQRRENQSITSYTWDSNVLSAIGVDNKYLQYLHDEMGSPARVVSEDNSTDVYRYNEFGIRAGLINKGYNNIAQPFTFTSYQLDEIAGTYYAQAREYQPHVGRFISKDIHWNPNNMIYGDNGSRIPDSLAVLQSGNLYGYTVNNPLKYIDPEGAAIITFTILGVVYIIKKSTLVAGATTVLVATTAYGLYDAADQIITIAFTPGMGIEDFDVRQNLDALTAGFTLGILKASGVGAGYLILAGVVINLDTGKIEEDGLYSVKSYIMTSILLNMISTLAGPAGEAFLGVFGQEFAMTVLGGHLKDVFEWLMANK